MHLSIDEEAERCTEREFKMSQNENLFARHSRYQIANVSIAARESIVHLDRPSSKAGTFYKMFTKYRGKLAHSMMRDVFATKIGLEVGKIFVKCSALHETFVNVDSSIPVQLVTGAASG